MMWTGSRKTVRVARHEAGTTTHRERSLGRFMPASTTSTHSPQRGHPPDLDEGGRGIATSLSDAALHHLTRPIVAACSAQDVLAAGCRSLGVALDSVDVAMTADDARAETTLFAAASRAASRAVTLQRNSGQGPHVSVERIGDLIVVDDLIGDARWPGTAGMLCRLGFRSVLALPVAFDGRRTGAASVYHPDARILEACQLRVARLVADATAAALAHHQRRDARRASSHTHLESPAPPTCTE
jgi:GAF domain-containing protein